MNANRNPIVHELKIWPEYFAKVRSGAKRFEYRKADRDYQVNDILHLFEYDPVKEQYTGRHIRVQVTYLLPVLADNGVILSIEGAVPVSRSLFAGDHILEEGGGI